MPNLPQEFLQKIQQIFPNPESQTQILTSLNPKPTTFRLNPLKQDPSQILQSLQDQAFQPEQSPFHEHAFKLTTKSKKELQQTKEYKEGHIYLQSYASQIPVLVLNPQPQEKILDMTAAPGSKTSQIAALTQNQSELHANDVNTIRLQKLQHNLKKLNSKATVHNLPGTELHKKFPKNYFDKILLDAPCSGEARFNIQNTKSYQYWSNHRTQEFHARQYKLIQSAYDLLAPNGTLVYSTCTFDPHENEEVIQRLIHQYPETIKILPIQMPNLQTLETLEKYKNTPLANTIRLQPSHDMESFYIAKIQKCTK